METGDKIPSIELLNIKNEKSNLSSFIGQKVIIYFYPRDNTSGCTTEACDFRDHKNIFDESGYTIIGISRDSIGSHLKFIEKHSLNFILLSDPDLIAHKSFGTWGLKKSYGKETMGVIRSTFVFDETGTLVEKYINIKAKGHVEKLINSLH
ncbi:MAG: peroxiredoxin [Deltaproteobacteria bacterium]|nr:peroxiredoxin [Deltaproteobacteria bacterium]